MQRVKLEALLSTNDDGMLVADLKFDVASANLLAAVMNSLRKTERNLVRFEDCVVFPRDKNVTEISVNSLARTFDEVAGDFQEFVDDLFSTGEEGFPSPCHSELEMSASFSGPDLGGEVHHMTIKVVYPMGVDDLVELINKEGFCPLPSVKLAA
jgi:hypothetical protein